MVVAPVPIIEADVTATTGALITMIEAVVATTMIETTDAGQGAETGAETGAEIGTDVTVRDHDTKTDDSFTTEST